MESPDLTGSFIFQGRNIAVEWHDALTMDDLPDVSWSQVYAIGNLKGKVPLVLYEDGRANLPGGTTESGETIDETIRRELVEEINCELMTWKPIGFQKLRDPSKDDPIYQMRVYAELRKIGDFTHDPGGSVIGYKLVDIEDVNDEIHYQEVGQRMVSIVKGFLNVK